MQLVMTNSGYKCLNYNKSYKGSSFLYNFRLFRHQLFFSIENTTVGDGRVDTLKDRHPSVRVFS